MYQLILALCQCKACTDRLWDLLLYYIPRVLVSWYYINISLTLPYFFFFNFMDSVPKYIICYLGPLEKNQN